MLLCGMNFINPIHFLLVFGINHQHVLSYNPHLLMYINKAAVFSDQALKEPDASGSFFMFQINIWLNIPVFPPKVFYPFLLNQKNIPSANRILSLPAIGQPPPAADNEIPCSFYPGRNLLQIGSIYKPLRHTLHSLISPGIHPAYPAW